MNEMNIVSVSGGKDSTVGADRFKVVRGAFWWHVLIGDSPTKHGKFGSRADAEKMAATLLREFRNGAFVQHEAALAEPEVEQEPVAWQYVWGPGMYYTTDSRKTLDRYVQGANRLPPEKRGRVRPLYTTPPSREWVSLTEEEIEAIWDGALTPYRMQQLREIENKLKEKNT